MKRHNLVSTSIVVVVLLMQIVFASWVNFPVRNGSFEDGVLGVVPDNWVVKSLNATSNPPPVGTFTHEAYQDDTHYFLGGRSCYLHSRVVDTDGTIADRYSHTWIESEDWIYAPSAVYVRFYIRDIQPTHSLGWGWNDGICFGFIDGIVDDFDKYFIYNNGETLNFNSYNDTKLGADGATWYEYVYPIPMEIDKSHFKVQINCIAGDWTFYSTSFFADNKFYVDNVELLSLAPVYYDWPMFRHDLSHSGYSNSTAPNTNSTMWSSMIGPIEASSPAVMDNKLYVGTTDHNIYCLDATTGARIWNYTTDDAVESSPSIAYGRVYCGTFGRDIYCLNASTGDLIWSSTPGSQDLFRVSSPAVADNKVYVGSGDNNVYCLDAATGAKIWNYTTGGAVWSSPLFSDGRVYVGSIDSNVYCLNGSTGDLIWSYATGNLVMSSPAYADGKVYVGCDDHYVYALDAIDGTLTWKTSIGWQVESSPAVAYGAVYIGTWAGSSGNGIFCLNATTGAIIWSFEIPVGAYSSPAIADNKVYVGSMGDNIIYCLNATTGDTIWTYTTGDGVLSSPAIVNGWVYVGSLDGKVYAFGEIHDIAITEVTTSKNGCLPRPTIGLGQTLSFNVTVENQGEYAEAFGVSVYANETPISSMQVALNPGENRTLNLTWNTSGFGYGNCTLRAVADSLPLETDVNDNVLNDTIVVTISGDINGDYKVTLVDLVLLANAYGSRSGNSKWNPNADINGNGVVDLADLVILAQHYNQHYP